VYIVREIDPPLSHQDTHACASPECPLNRLPSELPPWPPKPQRQYRSPWSSFAMVSS